MVPMNGCSEEEGRKGQRRVLFGFGKNKEIRLNVPPRLIHARSHRTDF